MLLFGSLSDGPRSGYARVVDWVMVPSVDVAMSPDTIELSEPGAAAIGAPWAAVDSTLATLTSVGISAPVMVLPKLACMYACKVTLNDLVHPGSPVIPRGLSLALAWPAIVL